MHALPHTGFVRASVLVGHKSQPGIIPVSPATLWRKVRAGTFPAPVKLGPNTTAWRVEDVRAWIEARGREDAA